MSTTTALIEGGSALARVEAVLRRRGPTSADRVATLLRCRRSTVLDALHRHPFAFHNGRPRRASRWAMVAMPTSRRSRSDYKPVLFTDKERARAPVEPQLPLVCPTCGCTHTVPGAVMRKIEKGARSARCASCSDGSMPFVQLPLTAEEWPPLARWWLDRYTDDEIADFALVLGVETASPANVALQRFRLRRAA